MHKILIFHLNQLGDFLFALPLAASLKAHFKDAKLIHVIRPHLRDLASLLPDNLGDGTIIRDLKRKTLFKDLGERADLAIFLSESPQCLLLAAMTKAEKKIGFQNNPLWSLVLDKGVPRIGPPSTVNFLRVLETLKVPARYTTYGGLSWQKRKKLKGTTPHIVIHPSSSPRHALKSWPPSFFVLLINLLIQKGIFNITLTGSGTDLELCGQIRAKVKAPINLLCGKTNLKDLAVLFANADLVIGNDSGASHLASFVGTPVLALFGPTDPTHTAPQGKDVRIFQSNLLCQPCLERSRCKENICMQEISPFRVFEEIRNFLLI